MSESVKYQIFKEDEIPSQEISDPAVLSKNPLVSCCMITYNHAPFIKQAIDSVLLQQTSFPFELVIGEDCSTDGTREIVFSYQEKYPHIIRVITSDKNVGMRQNGYRTKKACRGRYIAFCEGDDYWHDIYKLEKQVSFMEAHPECGLVFTDYDALLHGSNKLVKSVNYNKGFHSQMRFSLEQIIQGKRPREITCTAMIRRDLCEQIVESDHYLHTNFLMGDTQIWAGAAALSTVLYIPESTATYRVHGESASRSADRRKVLRFWKSNAEMKMYLCDKYKLHRNLRNKVEKAWLEKSLLLALYERNSNLALEVKKKKQKFTWKEWLWYLGARNSVVHFAYRVAVYFCDLLRGRDYEFNWEFGGSLRKKVKNGKS